MLSRRSFLGGLFGLTAGAIAVKPGYANPGEGEFYKGWEITWTGWKGSQNTEYLIGQWLAHNPRYDKMLYVNVPGTRGGKYYKGYVFDTSMDRDSVFITMKTSEEDKAKVMADAKKVLFSLIDNADEYANLRV